jgi:hypothetical protein
MYCQQWFPVRWNFLHDWFALFSAKGHLLNRLLFRDKEEGYIIPLTGASDLERNPGIYSGRIQNSRVGIGNCPYRICFHLLIPQLLLSNGRLACHKDHNQYDKSGLHSIDKLKASAQFVFSKEKKQSNPK